MTDADTLSIGEVINLLRDDFPDVSVSKLRFLESQELIDPRRSDSGYRKFDHDDVDRLRFILQQQRDHFLPLKVIKSKLTLWERGEEPSGPKRASALDGGGEPLDEAALLKRSGLEASQLRELESIGLLEPVAGSDVYSPESGIVATEAKRLLDLGLEPRHLRAVRLSADRVVDLLTRMVAPLLLAKNAEAHARARDVLETGSDSVNAMHRALIASDLREELRR